ncbi:MAG: porin [Gemmatimonadota bacterium]
MPRLHLAAALCLLAAAPLGAQDEFPSVRFEGRLQHHFYWLDNAAYADELGPRNGFFTRRARIEAQARLSERVYVVIEPSYEGGRVEGLSLKDAYVDVLLTEPETEPPLTLRLGQSKRPFGRYESMSSKNLPSIERGAGMGLFEVALNDLIEEERLSGRDIGVLFIARIRERVLLEAGIYNGEGESAPRDANDAKTLAARIGFEPLGRLNVGVSAVSHEGIADSVGPTVRHQGWGVDAGLGAPGEPGLFVLTEFVSAESFAETPARLRGGLLVLAYNILVERDALHSIEPVFRFDVADPDADQGNDHSTLVGAGLGLYLTDRAQFRVMYERQSFADPALLAIDGVRTALTVRF